MLKVLELFAGIGACSKALENLGIEHEIVDAVEIDKYAIKSFNAIHNTNFVTQDITKWDKDIEVDLVMHGSPCQDFSVAGKQAGGDLGSGTRSSLMYETVRIVGKLRPKYVIWENVKNVLSKTHKHNFDRYISAMEILGYRNYYQVLDAKDYGIPQHRERVFTVSILGDKEYQFPLGNEIDNKIKKLFNFSARQDCRVVYDAEGLSPTLVAGMGVGGGKVPMFIENFKFPKKEELKIRLKDILEDEVDEKYYLSEAMLNYMYGVNQKPSKFPRKERFEANINRKNQDIANSITTNAGNRPTDNFIKIKNATKKGYLEAYEGDSVNLAYPKSETRRGRVGKEVAQTLQCNDNVGVVVNERT